MPERILRDLTDSDPYNEVDANCRDLFIRLINKADDYGCYHADAKRLRANLYPLLLNRVREADVERWISAIAHETTGLVRIYESGGKKFLQIAKWRQRLRSKKRKFPVPPWKEDDITHYGTVQKSEAPHPPCGRHADVRHPLTESETEADTETEAGSDARPELKPERKPIWERNPTR